MNAHRRTDRCIYSNCEAPAVVWLTRRDNVAYPTCWHHGTLERTLDPTEWRLEAMKHGVVR